MLLTYCFSLQGKDHIKYDKPCQDYSAVDEISKSWKIIAVADGIGSCKHSEVASKIAVEAVIDLIKKQFPRSDADEKVYESLMLSAMNGAANAIEEYVEKNDASNASQYHTTLTVAIVSKKALYYANAGDSGIIALDENGEYHVVTTKQNSADGSVFAMPAYRRFEIGKADFVPVTVLCMSDGVLDHVVPALYQDPEVYPDQKYKVVVPFANVFTTFFMGIDDEEAAERVSNGRNIIIDFLQNDERCKNMTDDLSVAAVITTDSFLEPDDIPWEEPQIDHLRIKWKELAIYNHDPKAKIAEMVKYIRRQKPEWTEEQIKAYLRELRKPEKEQSTIEHTESEPCSVTDCEQEKKRKSIFDKMKRHKDNEGNNGEG